MAQTPVGSTATITAQEPQALSATVSRQRLISILIGVLLGMLLSALDQTIVGTALPRIVSELGGLNQYAWVVTAYLLASTVSIPLYGKLSDIYGRRIFFITGRSRWWPWSALPSFSSHCLVPCALLDCSCPGHERRRSFQEPLPHRLP